MDTLLQDLRYALRSLAKSPGFSAVVVLTLALGIGANTAIFTVINAVLLRPLQLREPDRLMVIRETYGGGTVGSVGGPNFLDWRDRSGAFETMTAFRGTMLSLVGAGEPEEIRGAVVSADFFTVIGVTPRLGRGFLPGEDQGQPAVAVIGDALWRTRFAADSGILGRAITLSGHPYTVVGVAPPGLNYPGRITVWIPIGFGAGQPADRSSHSYDVVGRLKAGRTVEQATADLAGVARALEREFPATNTGRGVVIIPLSDDIVGSVRLTLWLLAGAVGFVLLIACANVANLFLARSATRQREIAVRAALGAGRWRLGRQVLVEALTLAGAGGVVGLLVAAWAIDALLALQPRGIPRLLEISVDGTVLAFSLVVSLVVGVTFGVVPALSVASQDPADAFRGEGRAASAGRQRTRLRRSLVLAQMSLALILLTGAGLLIVSLRRLTGVALGFQPEGVATFQLTLATAKYPDARAQWAFLGRVVSRLEAIPGVQKAGTVFYLPLGDGDVSGDIAVAGAPPTVPGKEQYAGYRLVAGDYFSAMGLSLTRGRPLGAQDIAGAPAVAVINQAAAAKYFAGKDPLGQRIGFGDGGDSTDWRDIVGVVANVRHHGLAVQPDPEIYVPIAQLTPEFWGIFTSIPVSFVVRGDMGFDGLAPAIRAAIREVDPEQPISRLRPAVELVTDAVARPRFSMLLFTLFGLVALTLASVGVYGVMAYAVSQRTRELGIRMALGARAWSVQAMVLRQGLALALGGVALGVLGALALSRLLSSLLYEVRPSDPRVLAGVALILSLVSAVACLVPALRATRVDPIEALRSE